VFQAAWPDLEIRYKFDGYENLRAGVFGDALKRLHERFDGQFIAFNIPVDECMAQLSPRL
jgi:hypothetical protein